MPDRPLASILAEWRSREARLKELAASPRPDDDDELEDVTAHIAELRDEYAAAQERQRSPENDDSSSASGKERPRPKPGPWWV